MKIRKILSLLVGVGILGGVGVSTVNANVTIPVQQVQLLANHQKSNEACVINGNGDLTLTNGNGQTVGYISVGQMLQVQGQANGKTLVTVQETGATGYISNNNMQMITGATSDSLTRMNRQGQIINVSSDVHVRTDATMSSSIVANLTNGTNITITGKQGNWYRVNVNGVKGFVYGEYVGEGVSQTGGTVTVPSTTNQSTLTNNNNNNIVKAPVINNNNGSLVGKKQVSINNSNGLVAQPNKTGSETKSIGTVKHEVTPVAKPVVKHEVTPVAKPVVKHEVTPVAKPVVKHDTTPVAKPVVKHDTTPVAKPVVKHDTTPVVKPVVKHDTTPVAKPVVKHDITPVAKPVVKHDTTPMAKPVVKHDTTPVAKPVVKHDTTPVVKPVVKHDTTPVAKPVVKHDTTPVVKPVVKHDTTPVAKPVVKHDTTPVVKPVVKHDTTPVAKPVVKHEVTPVAKPVVKHDTNTTKPVEHTTTSVNNGNTTQNTNRKMVKVGSQEFYNIANASLLQWTNKYRVHEGLSPLTENSSLTQMANWIANENVANNRFSDYTPNGQNVYAQPQFSSLITIANGNGFSENLALTKISGNEVSVKTAEGVGEQCFFELIESAPHKANILNPKSTQIGISTRIYPNGNIIMAQEFGDQL